jgi:hypothetical protein
LDKEKPGDKLKIMGTSANTFFLLSKGVTLGTVTLERHDWPWIFGRFTPSAEFSDFRTTFTSANTASRARNQQELDDSIRKIVAMELQLIRCDSGILVGEPDMLWIDGDQINWRGFRGALREHYKS